MARKKTRTVYKKRGYRRAKGTGFKPIIDGLLAGIAGQLASKWIGGYGHPAASIGIGMWRNNTVLKTEGARELGAMLATNIPFIGGTSPYGVLINGSFNSWNDCFKKSNYR